MSLQLRSGLIVGGACLALLCSSTYARVIEDWPYEKLFKHAELVVIVKPQSVRDATKEDRATPHRDHLIGVVTSFHVLHVVKGEYKPKKLELVHFRLKEGVMIKNGPMLVSFHTSPVRISGPQWSRRAGNAYMLFLKKDKDGRLTFVSGQGDPVLSVKQILSPLPKKD